MPGRVMRAVPQRVAVHLLVSLALFAGVPLGALELSLNTEPGSTGPSLKISGFADISFSATDEDDNNAGFKEGQFILHFASALSSRVSFFAETSLTARNGSDPKADIERMFIRFDYADPLKLSLGRYHTPINWWNSNFHHGLWLQTTIDRPEMSKFGGPYIPVHFLGGLAEGVLPAGGLNFTYNVGFGNGRGEPITHGGDAGDNNDFKAFLGNFFIRPDRFYGLQLGVSGYRDRITLKDSPAVREWITAAHAVWQREDPELIGEVAWVHHDPSEGGNKKDSVAGYLQAAYRLPFWDDTFKPYYRWEYTGIPTGDETFESARTSLNEQVHTAGVRWDVASFVAVKTEYRNFRKPGRPEINGGFFQVSVTF